MKKEGGKHNVKGKRKREIIKFMSIIIIEMEFHTIQSISYICKCSMWSWIWIPVWIYKHNSYYYIYLYML